MRPVYRPVNGGSKTERIKFANMPNAITEAAWKRFREHSRRKQIFDIDRNIEVYAISENIYGLYHPNCDGGGDVWMYLIVGTKKAFLIDTAYGLGDLKGLCSLLSGGKELIVANTHVGPDHVFGNFRFGHVFCHEYEAENIAARLQPENCFDYLFDENGHPIWLKFDKEDLPKHKKPEICFLGKGEKAENPERDDTVVMIGVPDGYTWDIGGREIELIWTGGHMPGHSMFLDKADRVLIAGDDVCGDIIGISGPKPNLKNCQYRNVYTYRERLKELVKRTDEFDYIFPGHYMGFIESTVLYNILDTLNAIVDNPESYDYKELYHSGSGAVFERMYKRVKGFGDVAYEWDSVYPAGEEPEEYRKAHL